MGLLIFLFLFIQIFVFLYYILAEFNLQMQQNSD